MWFYGLLRLVPLFGGILSGFQNLLFHFFQCVRKFLLFPTPRALLTSSDHSVLPANNVILYDGSRSLTVLLLGFLICLWKVFLWTWDTLEDRAVFDTPFLSSGLLCPVPFSCTCTNLLKADGAQMILLQAEVFRSTEVTDAIFSRVFVSYLPSFNTSWQTVLFLFSSLVCILAFAYIAF